MSRAPSRAHRIAGSATAAAAGRRRTLRHRRAFTLVETLIAMGIAATLMAGMAAAMDLMLRQPAAVHQAAQARGRARAALRRMTAELAEARLIHAIVDDAVHQRIVFAVPEDPDDPQSGLQALKFEWLQQTGMLRFGWAEQYGADSAPISGRSVDLLTDCTEYAISIEGEVAPAAGGEPGERFHTAAGIRPAEEALAAGRVRVRTIALHVGMMHDGRQFHVSETVHCTHHPLLWAYATDP